MNCEKNYNHTLSRVRAYAHSRSFCLFAVTSVTVVSVNGTFSVVCMFICAIFNKKNDSCLQNLLDVPTKIALFFFCILQNFSPFFPDFLLACDTCDSKKTTLLLERVRATRTREENAQCDSSLFLVLLLFLLRPLNSARIRIYNPVNLQSTTVKFYIPTK